MSLITDVQFAPRMAPYLKRFKHLGGYTWSFRCPYCGDSKKSKAKCRGGFFRGKDEMSDMLLMNCFNCGVSTTLGKVIERFAPELYDEYKFEFYRGHDITLDDHQDDVEIPVDPEFFNTASRTIEIVYDAALDNIKSLDCLSENHPAVKYIAGRNIPREFWNLFYFAPKFMTWVNTLIPEKFELRDKDYPRLVLPYFNEHGRMFAFAGRSFGKEEPKYITIKLVDSEEKIYGRERLDYSKLIFVVEGQIDSLLLPNAIAVSGSSFDTPFVQGIKTNCVLVPDNEPRNKDIAKLYRKYILAGYRVCMLPETFEYKDINEAYSAGMSPEEISKLILDNTYEGFTAELQFSTWCKCDLGKIR